MSTKASTLVEGIIERGRVKFTGLENAVLRRLAYLATKGSLTTPLVSHSEIAKAISVGRRSVERACVSLHRKEMLDYTLGSGRKHAYTIRRKPREGTESSIKKEHPVPSIKSEKEHPVTEKELDVPREGTSLDSNVTPKDKDTKTGGAARSSSEKLDQEEGRPTRVEGEELDNPFPGQV